MDDSLFCLLKEEGRGLDQKPELQADWVNRYESQKIRQSVLKFGIVLSEAEVRSWSVTKLKAFFGICNLIYNLVCLSCEVKRSMCPSQLR